MECGKRQSEQVVELVCGDLNAAKRNTFEAHVSNCSQCGAEVEMLRRAVSALRDWFSPLPNESALRLEPARRATILEMARAFDADAAADALPPPNSAAVFWQRALRPVLFAAATVVVAGLLMYHYRTPERRTSTPLAAAAKTPAQAAPASVAADALRSDTGLTVSEAADETDVAITAARDLAPEPMVASAREEKEQTAPAMSTAEAKDATRLQKQKLRASRALTAPFADQALARELQEEMRAPAAPTRPQAAPKEQAAGELAERPQAEQRGAATPPPNREPAREKRRARLLQVPQPVAPQVDSAPVRMTASAAAEARQAQADREVMARAAKAGPQTAKAALGGRALAGAGAPGAADRRVELDVALDQLPLTVVPVSDFAYPRPGSGDLAVTVATAASPLEVDRTLMRVAIQAGPAPREDPELVFDNVSLHVVFPSGTVASCRLLAGPILLPAPAQERRAGLLHPGESLTLVYEIRPRGDSAARAAIVTARYRSAPDAPLRTRQAPAAHHYGSFRQAPPAFRLAALTASVQSHQLSSAARAAALGELRSLAAEHYDVEAIRRLIERQP